MARLALPSIDRERLRAQFQGLSGRHPGLWPLLPRTLLLMGLFAALVAVGYSLYWRDLLDRLEAGGAEEFRHKTAYTEKIRFAAKLYALPTQQPPVDQ